MHRTHIFLLLCICLIEGDIFISSFFAVEGTGYCPCKLEHFLITIFGFGKISIKPSSIFFSFPILFKFIPTILLPVVLYSIHLWQMLAANDGCLLGTIVGYDMRTIETSHLMPVNTLMVCMSIFKTTYSSTTRTFLIAYIYFNTLNILEFIFLDELK